MTFILQVSLEQRNATVMFDHNQQNPESLSEAIEDMGFELSLPVSVPATPVSTETQLVSTSGLAPAAQEEALEKLSQIQGVLDVRESQVPVGLTVTYVPSLTSPLQLNELVASLSATEIPTPSSPVQKGPTVSPSQSRSGDVALLKLRIEGMTCHSCTSTIEGKIGKLKGIKKIKGDVLDLLTRCSLTVKLEVIL